MSSRIVATKREHYVAKQRDVPIAPEDSAAAP
jgi:hypothetical protein